MKKMIILLLGFAIIILLGIIIYSDSFDCSFHLDDFGRIVNNTSIHKLADVKAWWETYPTRPLGMFTFALNYHFNHLDVYYYHFVNVIIHLINACLVWWLTLLIFSSPIMKDQPIARNKKVLAFLTALLFVSHPLATQAVTYIVQRMASMVAMFYLLSLALYVKARLSNKGNISKTLFYIGSLFSAVFAMLTKENAFTLPFAIMLIEFFFLRTKKLSINFRDYRVILLVIAILGIIIFKPLIFSFSIFKLISPMVGHAYTVTPLNYLFTQFSVIVKYIQLLFLPINQKLEYDFPISSTFFEIRTLLSFVALSSLIILAIFFSKRYRIISFGIFWFLLTLSIESSFIPLNDLIFEHRTYLPSFGFFLILTSGIFLLLWNKHKYLVFSILVIIIGSNSYLTYERNKIWKNELTLWNDNVAKTPNLPIALVNRGSAYNNVGQWDMAIADYSTAIKINPKNILPYINRGVVFYNIKEMDKAITDFSKAIEIDPQYTAAYYNLGNTYKSLGKWENALTDYSKAIECDPENSAVYSNRGIVYYNIREMDKAITDFSKAIEIDPKNSTAYSNRGIVYYNIKQIDKAITDFSKAIEIDLKYLDAYSNRGLVYVNIGQWDKAIVDYSKAIEINPKYFMAYFYCGIAYMNLGQWDKSIANYTKAIEIHPNFVEAYSNRGAAYGKLGQWNKALSDFSKAIEMSPNFTEAYTNRDIAIRNLKSRKSQEN
jgi:tetratricopeptide (TPR) repeat protein